MEAVLALLQNYRTILSVSNIPNQNYCVNISHFQPQICSSKQKGKTNYFSFFLWSFVLLIKGASNFCKGVLGRRALNLYLEERIKKRERCLT